MILRSENFKSSAATNYATRALFIFQILHFTRKPNLYAVHLVNGVGGGLAVYQMHSIKILGWRSRPGSNRRITLLQSVALTNFATGSYLRILYGMRDFVYFLAIFLAAVDFEIEKGNAAHVRPFHEKYAEIGAAAL